MPDTIALVGSETLMGRELRDMLADDSLGAELRLVAGDDAASGVIAEQAGEPAVTAKLDEIALLDADVVILAGVGDSSLRALHLAGDLPIIDLTHAAEDRPRSRLRAPMVEPHDFRVAPDAIQSIAHPAAIALTLLLSQVSLRYRVAGWTAHIFEPASERGSAGIDELQAQTVSLLSFKPMKKKVFDAQLAFTLLARLGEEAVAQLEEVEARIERHLATLLQNAAHSPMPSIRLVQAPVFHGHSFSIRMEFEGEVPSAAELESGLAGDHVEVYSESLETLNNVSVAGHDAVLVGAVTRDRNDPKALWLWMVSDNLRLAARNAVLVARELL